MARRPAPPDSSSPTPPVASPAAGSGRAHLNAAAAAPDEPSDRPRGWARLVARLKVLVAWWQATRAARANARFGAAGGGLLTGGIAYTTLFSVVAALTLVFTIALGVLGSNEVLRAQVVDAVAGVLPGLIDTGDGEGLIRPESLRLTTGLNIAGLVSIVVLVMTAIRAVSALRTAVRAMFALTGGDNVVTGKLRELAGLGGMALAVLASAVLTLAATSAADWLTGALGWSGSSGLLVRVAGVLVSFVIDAATFVLVVRVLAQADPPRRDLLWGALIAGVGMGVVRVLGTSVVSGSVSGNPVLGSFAAIVVLLAWINLLARIILLAAAWTADPPPAETA